VSLASFQDLGINEQFEKSTNVRNIDIFSTFLILFQEGYAPQARQAYLQGQGQDTITQEER